MPNFYPIHRIAIIILYLFTLLAAWNTAAKGEANNPETRPNIIVIMSDDMGYSDLGCYGGEIDTPNIDALAYNGLRFTQFYNTSRCCPTRASLLTGLYPHQTGIGTMLADKNVPGYRGDLNKQCVTIAEVLKKSGYKTYLSGKWHVTKQYDVSSDAQKYNWPLQRGFDKFFGTIHGAGSFWDPKTLVRNNEYITPFNDPEYQSEQWYYTDAISDNAVQYIQQHQNEHSENPFFLYVAYTAPHWPLHALEKDIAKYKGKYDAGYAAIRKARLKKMRELGVIEPDWSISKQQGDWEGVDHKPWEARNMEVYAAMIDNMDQGIGRIINALKNNGQLENTLILFLHDNGGCGEEIGRKTKGTPRPDKPPFAAMPSDKLQKDLVPKQTRDGYPVRQGRGVMAGPADTYLSYGRGWGNVSNTPFREYKKFVHEGGIATPLITHWPNGIAAKNEFRTTPGHVIDIMATCLDAAKANYPKAFNGKTIKPLEGISLLPIFVNKEIKRKTLFWEHKQNCAVRDGKWKLVGKHVLSSNGKIKNEKWELYNIEEDRTETNNLAKANPKVVESLASKYLNYCNAKNLLPRK